MREVNWTPVSRTERLKYEAAAELGLIEKLLEVGWSGLTARETGMVGARVSGRLTKE